MKMINPSLLIILLIPLLLPSFSLAKESPSALDVAEAQDNKNKLLHLAAVSVLPINAELLALMTQLRQTSIDSEKIELALTRLSFAKATLNVAEQYLLLVTQALLKNKATDKGNDGENSRDIIVLLEQATKLSAQIFEPQLHQPNFLK